MIKLTFELPDEITEIIKAQGYDVEGYIELHFVRPLVDALKAQKRQQIVDEAQPAIDTKVEDIKSQIKTDRHDFASVVLSYGKATDENYKEETVTLEINPKTGDVIEALPKGAKIKTILQEDHNQLK